MGLHSAPSLYASLAIGEVIKAVNRIQPPGMPDTKAVMVSNSRLETKREARSGDVMEVNLCSARVASNKFLLLRCLERGWGQRPSSHLSQKLLGVGAMLLLSACEHPPGGEWFCESG